MSIRRILICLSFLFIIGSAAPAPATSQGAIMPLATPQIISIWGGARHSLVLAADGTVWDWGLSHCGLVTSVCSMLGDGTFFDRHVPIQVHGPDNVGYLSAISAIMGGEQHSFALKSDGTVWAWGWNGAGQLGDGTYTDRLTPTQVSGLSAVTRLGGRGYHNLAVKADGTVWAWGWNNHGQLGHDTSASPCPVPLDMTCSNVPVQVVGVTNPLTVTGGGFFSLALMPDHTLLAWGQGSLGELGNGASSDSATPVHVSNVLSNVVQVSAGWHHAVALTADGSVWAWGDNTYGEIGNGTASTTGVNVPYRVAGLSHAVAVSAGDGHTSALTVDGTVWKWGKNDVGELGDGTWVDKHTPVAAVGLTHVIAMTARDYHNLAITADGSLWAWGSNNYGQLGDNTTIDRATPVQVLFGQPSGTLWAFLPLVQR